MDMINTGSKMYVYEQKKKIENWLKYVKLQFSIYGAYRHERV